MTWTSLLSARRVTLAVCLISFSPALATSQQSTPQLSPNAPKDRPVETAQRCIWNAMDAAMQPYIAQARATWPAAKQRYVHVSDSRVDGNVSTGGGVVRIEGVTGNIIGQSGSGPVIQTKSSSTSVRTENGDTLVAVATGDGEVHVGTGIGKGSGKSTGTISSGRIRIGPSGGEVYAMTGGGDIDIGPATGSVEAHTGAGDVKIELKGAGAHSVNVTSGRGEVVLVVPRDLDATLELETAYTNNLGHATRILSDLPLKTTETADWDAREGTPRRYVRARETLGKGGGIIRVRAVNGNVVLNRAR